MENLESKVIMENLTPEFVQKVIALQKKVCVSKDRPNTFGGFKYRALEDILDKSKPAAAELGLLMFLSDDIVTRQWQDEVRFYAEATVVLTDGRSVIRATGYAREAEHKTKSDDAQVTGMASSYARKYCLSGLLQIGGMAEDIDGQNHGEDEGNEPKEPAANPVMDKKQVLGNILHDVVAKGYRADDLKVLVEIHFNKYSSKDLTMEEVKQLQEHYVEWLKRDIPGQKAV